MIDILDTHIVQSPEWGEFKTKMGTRAIKIGDIQFTKHKIPFAPYYVAYAPKVNFITQKISFTELKEMAKAENCICVRFDVPNIIKTTSSSSQTQKIVKLLESKCVKAPRSTFTKWNIFIDLNKTEEELISSFQQKTRYNIKLASKKGVEIKKENNERGLAIFEKLNEENAKRHKFLLHPRKYYREAFNSLYKKNMANILVAYYQGIPLVSWMLFNYKNTLYYPYGGSSTEHTNLMPSNLIAWEAIRLGKSLNCKIFDMWGATNDRENSYWGFTKFKLGYGGELMELLDSYDFITNPVLYKIFVVAYEAFWKVKKAAITR